MITMWSSLKSHFGCSYKEISDEQFTEALSLAARVPLEGELIGKQEKKTNELSAKKQTALYGYGIMPIAHRHYSANCIRH